MNKTRLLYHWVLTNKLITICTVFTIITVLNSIMMITGLDVPKDGVIAYAHLLSRFVLLSLVVFSLSIFDRLKERINNRLIVYLLVYPLTLFLMLIYVWGNGLFTELHPDAYVDVSISYSFMYMLIGIVILAGYKFKGRSTK